MNPTADIHALVGAYALDALEPAERAEFEVHLEKCEACQVEAAELQMTASGLAASVETPPPPALKSSLMDAIGQVQQEAPQRAKDSHAGDIAPVVALSDRRHSERVIRIVAQAAAVVAVLAVGTAVVTGANNTDQQERIVALEEQVAALGGGQVTDILASADLQSWRIDGPDGSSARLIYSASHSQGWLLGSGMGTAPEGHTYELWLIGDDGPIPAGIFDAHEDGHVATSFTAMTLDATAIGVTIEPDGGSPQPTTDPVMLIDL